MYIIKCQGSLFHDKKTGSAIFSKVSAQSVDFNIGAIYLSNWYL